MKALTKHELAGQLATSCELTKAEAVNIVETLCDLIICWFCEGGERVSLNGFGAFKQSRRREFKTTDPQGGAITVPARVSIVFKPSVEAVRRINHYFK